MTKLGGIRGTCASILLLCGSYAEVLAVRGRLDLAPLSEITLVFPERLDERDQLRISAFPPNISQKLMLGGKLSTTLGADKDCLTLRTMRFPEERLLHELAQYRYDAIISQDSVVHFDVALIASLTVLFPDAISRHSFDFPNELLHTVIALANKHPVTEGFPFEISSKKLGFCARVIKRSRFPRDARRLALAREFPFTIEFCPNNDAQFTLSTYHTHLSDLLDHLSPSVTVSYRGADHHVGICLDTQRAGYMSFGYSKSEPAVAHRVLNVGTIVLPDPYQRCLIPEARVNHYATKASYDRLVAATDPTATRNAIVANLRTRHMVGNLVEANTTPKDATTLNLFVDAVVCERERVKKRALYQSLTPNFVQNWTGRFHSFTAPLRNKLPGKDVETLHRERYAQNARDYKSDNLGPHPLIAKIGPVRVQLEPTLTPTSLRVYDTVEGARCTDTICNYYGIGPATTVGEMAKAVVSQPGVNVSVAKSGVVVSAGSPSARDFSRIFIEAQHVFLAAPKIWTVPQPPLSSGLTHTAFGARLALYYRRRGRSWPELSERYQRLAATPPRPQRVAEPEPEAPIASFIPERPPTATLADVDSDADSLQSERAPLIPRLGVVRSNTLRALLAALPRRKTSPQFFLAPDQEVCEVQVVEARFTRGHCFVAYDESSLAEIMEMAAETPRRTGVNYMAFGGEELVEMSDNDVESYLRVLQYVATERFSAVRPRQLPCVTEPEPEPTPEPLVTTATRPSTGSREAQLAAFNAIFDNELYIPPVRPSPTATPSQLVGVAVESPITQPSEEEALEQAILESALAESKRQGKLRAAPPAEEPALILESFFGTETPAAIPHAESSAAGEARAGPAPAATPESPPQPRRPRQYLQPLLRTHDITQNSRMKPLIGVVFWWLITTIGRSR